MEGEIVLKIFADWKHRRQSRKDAKRRLSTRQLMGIDQITDHGLKTAAGELVFYLLAPDNLSVMPVEGVHGRVKALTDLLRSMEAVELLALDSRESFLHNKLYYQSRLEQEELPAVRELLRRDMAHLDEILSTTASAREFALVCRITDKGSTEIAALNQMEKRIRDCGFHGRLAEAQDVMRLLAVYYQQDITTDHFDRFDGERYVNA